MHSALEKQSIIRWDRCFHDISLEVSPIWRTLCILIAHDFVRLRPLRVSISPALLGPDSIFERTMHFYNSQSSITSIERVPFVSSPWSPLQSGNYCAFWQLMNVTHVRWGTLFPQLSLDQTPFPKELCNSIAHASYSHPLRASMSPTLLGHIFNLKMTVHFDS